MKKVIVLLSGGLDSVTTLFLAKRSGYKTSCLIFDYGQRHRKEVGSARRIAKMTKCSYRVMKINLPWGGSSLLDKHRKIPQKGVTGNIPNTYVPARNTIFIAYGISWAEAIGAEAVYIGANALDYSGYPDCRPEYFEKYQRLIETAIKQKVIRIEVPLLHKTKSEIVKIGISLGVPYHLSWSCYRGGANPCGKCDSCRLRAKGFDEAGIVDPLINYEISKN